MTIQTLIQLAKLNAQTTNSGIGEAFHGHVTCKVHPTAKGLRTTFYFRSAQVKRATAELMLD